ncbi:MAG TPA: DUF2231 domain-containing protein [Candidatus Binatia bacterium]|nr:DUF2231 domain-containing protein [Candidatus Binatia bacterium]
MELFQGLREMPNVHMIAVHFPIALLPVSLVCDALARLTGSRDLHATARWTLWIGTIAAGVAVWTGIAGADDVHPYVTDAAEELMTRHMNLQLGTLAAAVVLSLWRLVARPYPWRGGALYLLISAAMVLNMLIASDIGGQMVFLRGVAVRVDADSLQGGEEKGHAGHHHNLLELFGLGEEEEHEHEHEHPGGHEHQHQHTEGEQHPL